MRAIGVHTKDKSALPTNDLPWAYFVNSLGASVSGIGTTPIGLVEGSWVFGIWVDGDEYQIPIILGSLSGKPDEQPDYQFGFSDPNKIYPLPEFLNESDLPRLARSVAETDATLINKRDAKKNLGEVPIAVGSKVSSVLADKDSSYYERTTWQEPNPRYGGENTIPEGVNQSTYPFNWVRQSESGHIEEWDDTPGSERLHRYHRAGTFEEIQPDGSRVIKVVGDDYEIAIKDKKMLVAGNLEITVSGDAHLYVQGDKFEEIDGNYFLTVKKDMITKVQGNDAKEVLSDKSTNVNEKRKEHVGKTSEWIIDSDESHTIGGNQTHEITGNETHTIGGNQSHTISGSQTHNVTGNASWIVGSNYTMTASGTVAISGSSTGTIAMAGTLAITASIISLN